MRAPIVIMSFNRPQYLKPVLESLKAQREGSLDGREIHLFQDGGVNRYSRIRYAREEELAASVEVFRSIFPAGFVHLTKTNISICENFRRAERYVFEIRDFECAYFFEDDLVLSPVYLDMMDRLRAWAETMSNVAYFAAYGNYYAKPEENDARRRALMTLDHHWAFGLLRRHWLTMQPQLEHFYKTVVGTDYSRRHHRDIFALYEPLNASPRASSQDAAKAFACDRLGLWRCNTVLPFAKYIGSTGQHMTPEAYASLGFERTVMASEPVTDLELPSPANIATYLGEQRTLFEQIRKTEFSTIVAGLPARKYDPGRKCDRDDVIFGYRLFLDREPESEAVIKETAGRQTVFDFVNRLAASAEFKALGAGHKRPCTREDVVYAYRLCLHRDPDGEEVVQRQVDAGRPAFDVARNLMASGEYTRLMPRIEIAAP